jgi:hypothetical protein
VSAALRDQLRRLADARANHVSLVDELTARRAAFDLANNYLLDGIAEIGSMIATAEADVRALAVSTYGMTGDKKPAPGVEIVLASKMDYPEGEAFAWAQQTGMALVPQSLDRKAFEKIAKATPLPFVIYRQEPSVRIATQLSAALLTEPATAEASV